MRYSSITDARGQSSGSEQGHHQPTHQCGCSFLQLCLAKPQKGESVTLLVLCTTFFRLTYPWRLLLMPLHACKSLNDSISNDMGVLMNIKCYAPPSRGRDSPCFVVCEETRGDSSKKQGNYHCQTTAGGRFAKAPVCSIDLGLPSWYPVSSSCFLMMKVSITKANTALFCSFLLSDISFIISSSQKNVHQ